MGRSRRPLPIAKRLQPNLTDEQLRRWNELKDICQVRTDQSMFDEMLSTYYHLVQSIREDKKKVTLIDEQGRQTEFLTTALFTAAKS